MKRDFGGNRKPTRPGYRAMAENLCQPPRNLAAAADVHSPIVEAGLGSLAPSHRKLTLRLTIPMSSLFF